MTAYIEIDHIGNLGIRSPGPLTMSSIYEFVLGENKYDPGCHEDDEKIFHVPINLVDKIPSEEEDLTPYLEELGRIHPELIRQANRRDLGELLQRAKKALDGERDFERKHPELEEL